MFRLQVVEPVQVYSMSIRSINLLLWSGQGKIHFINENNVVHLHNYAGVVTVSLMI